MVAILPYIDYFYIVYINKEYITFYYTYHQSLKLYEESMYLHILLQSIIVHFIRSNLSTTIYVLHIHLNMNS